MKRRKLARKYWEILEFNVHGTTGLRQAQQSTGTLREVPRDLSHAFKKGQYKHSSAMATSEKKPKLSRHLFLFIFLLYVVSTHFELPLDWRK